MSTATARALLVLPDPTENYAISIVNANMTALDGHLGFAPFTNSTRPASAFSGRTIRETDTERLFYSRGTAPISASWVQVLTEGASANLAASASFMIGGDTRIYRTGAGALRTPGTWTVDGASTLTGAVTTGAAVTVGTNLTVNGTPAASASLLASWGGAWSTWSPTLTNVTQGTGPTIVARYTQVGKTVKCQLQITLGSGGDVTGDFTVSLPVTARATSPNCIGAGHALDASVGVTGHRGVFVLLQTTTTVTFVASTGGVVAASVPFDWTSSDQLRVFFEYEAA